MAVDLLQVSNDLRARLERQDGEALDRLEQAYLLSVPGVERQSAALVEWLETHPNANSAQVKNSAAYKNLMVTITEELDDYEVILKTEVRRSANESADNGLIGGQALIIAALASALGVRIQDVPADVYQTAGPDALDFLADYLNPAGPLYERINSLSSYHAEQIAAGIIEQVTQGKNPRDVADWIVDAYGMPLTDALRTTRTVQLYSYRQAESAQYTANGDVLEGVVWSAELGDGRACISCIALHGQVFPLGTLANDHHNGRCAMIPLVKGEGNIIEQTGQAWFEGLDEGQQRDIMGAKKWEAWQDGKFEFSALSQPYQDDVYGEMRREASLKDLIGDE
jgi:hypothetical protein